MVAAEVLPPPTEALDAAGVNGHFPFLALPLISPSSSTGSCDEAEEYLTTSGLSAAITIPLYPLGTGTDWPAICLPRNAAMGVPVGIPGVPEGAGRGRKKVDKGAEGVVYGLEVRPREKGRRLREGLEGRGEAEGIGARMKVGDIASTK